MKTVYIYITLFFIQVIVMACSQINTESREYYSQKKANDNFNHGFIPRYTEEEIAEFKSEESPFDSVAAKRGKIIYQNHCMKCHGQKGQGNGPLAKKFGSNPLNLAEAVKSTPNFGFFIDLSKNTSNMPGWSEKEFSEKELSDLTQYLRTFAMKRKEGP